MEGNAPTTTPTAPFPNPALNVSALDGRQRVAQLHQALTDHLHYQSHVRLFAATSLPATVSAPEEVERRRIIQILKQEQQLIPTLRFLLDTIEANNKDLLELYGESQAHGWT